MCAWFRVWGCTNHQLSSSTTSDLPCLSPSASLCGLLPLFRCLPVHLTVGIKKLSVNRCQCQWLSCHPPSSSLNTGPNEPCGGNDSLLYSLRRWSDNGGGAKVWSSWGTHRGGESAWGSRQLSRLWCCIWPSSPLAGVLQMSYIHHCCGNNHTQLPSLLTPTRWRTDAPKGRRVGIQTILMPYFSLNNTILHCRHRFSLPSSP